MAGMRKSMSMEQASLLTSPTNRSLGPAGTPFSRRSATFKRIVDSERRNNKKVVETS